jgi:hypothetical protein
VKNSASPSPWRVGAGVTVPWLEVAYTISSPTLLLSLFPYIFQLACSSWFTVLFLPLAPLWMDSSLLSRVYFMGSNGKNFYSFATLPPFLYIALVHSPFCCRGFLFMHYKCVCFMWKPKKLSTVLFN